MKKLILNIILFTSIVSSSFAQQLNFNGQYMLNPYLFNPAAAGTQKYLSIAGSFRRQWVGFDDAPSTQMLSINSKLGKKMGLGGIIYNDVTGPLQNLNVSASYAYRLQVSKNSQLSLGLSLNLTQHSLNTTNFVLNSTNDRTLNAGITKSLSPNATFGMHYFGDNFFVGIAIPQLMENQYKYESIIETANKQVRHYFVSGGVELAAGANFELAPSTLLKIVSGAPLQYDIGLRLIYKEYLWLGANYRNDESIAALFGLKKGRFVIGYSYDFVVSNINNYSSGSHELYLELQLRRVIKRKKVGHKSLLLQ